MIDDTAENEKYGNMKRTVDDRTRWIWRRKQQQMNVYFTFASLPYRARSNTQNNLNGNSTVPCSNIP